VSDTEPGIAADGAPATLAFPASPRPQRRRPRVHTIVWGAILVGIALIGLRLGRVDAPFSGPAVLWSVVAFGGLLILAAVLAAIIRLARH
jgi:hydrogenase/urease accessory protein HupE